MISLFCTFPLAKKDNVFPSIEVVCFLGFFFVYLGVSASDSVFLPKKGKKEEKKELVVNKMFGL